jgi:hypothetical protein
MVEFEAMSKSWLTDVEKNFIASALKNRNNIEEGPSKMSTNVRQRYCNTSDYYENISISCNSTVKVILPKEVDRIVSHGFTIYRNPENWLQARICLQGNDNWLLGIQVHSQIKTPEIVSEYGDFFQDNVVPECYRESIEVSVSNTQLIASNYGSSTWKKCNTLVKNRHFSTTKYNSYTKITFDNPIYLKSESSSFFVINIKFNCKGFYPISKLQSKFDNVFDANNPAQNFNLSGYTLSKDCQTFNSGLFKSLYIMKSSDMRMITHNFITMH